MKSFVYDKLQPTRPSTINASGAGKSMPAVAIQKKGGPEDELPTQGKFTTQKVSAEEEPLQGKFPIQKVGGPEEELPVQGKFTTQKVSAEEEPLQGKFPIQKVGGPEEELPVQGKFPIQKVGGPEEELPVQGKFPIQKVGGPEEELPVQGKFITQMKSGIEEEEPVQGKFAIQKKEGPDEEPLQMKTAQLATEDELPVQKKKNDTGLPDNLKSGIENLSGLSMNDVKVHYNSSKPAQLQALAYAQGTDIHVAPGQEKHLPHEAWHVAQQKQGRVQPTMQMKEGVAVNDDKGLESEADVMGAKAMQMKYPDGQTANALTNANASDTAQLTFDKAYKPINNLADLNTKLGALNPVVAALNLVNLGVGGITASMVDAAIAANNDTLYDSMTQADAIAFFTTALTGLVNTTPINYTYDGHGDKHFVGGGKQGTKFTAVKGTVNPILVGLIAPHIGRIRRDAAGANQTYYLTMAGITQCPGGHDLTIQVDYEHSTNKITYHGYPDNNVGAYSLSRAKGGAAIP